MKRILMLLAISLLLCSNASAFQGGGGQPTRSPKPTPNARSRSARKPRVETRRRSSAPTAGVEVTTPSGLKYVDLILGSGESPRKGQTVIAEYIGTLANGTEFDSSAERAQPFQFRVGTGSAIKGWDEGVMTMKVGGSRRLIIPANLAYGAAGRPPNIPPNATLIFQIRLLSVKSDNTTRSEPRFSSPPLTAELTIRTLPGNALILIDGQGVGVTGEEGVLNLPTLKPGEHIIVARRERYRDAQRTIMLEANQSQIVELGLIAVTGTLNINVNPGDAQIEIDGHGSYADKVSNLELDAGTYSVTASKPGYQTFSKSVEIEPGLAADLTIALEPVVAANPQLAFVGRENFVSGGQNFTRYKLAVTNSASYAQDMFASAPDLPPCGLNNKSSRTWVDVYDRRGVRLYGFCALSKPSDLSLIWFALPAQLAPPSVYVVLNDRLKNKEYKSNLVAIP